MAESLGNRNDAGYGRFGFVNSIDASAGAWLIADQRSFTQRPALPCRRAKPFRSCRLYYRRRNWFARNFFSSGTESRTLLSAHALHLRDSRVAVCEGIAICF